MPLRTAGEPASSFGRSAKCAAAVAAVRRRRRAARLRTAAPAMGSSRRCSPAPADATCRRSRRRRRRRFRRAATPALRRRRRPPRRRVDAAVTRRRRTSRHDACSATGRVCDCDDDAARRVRRRLRRRIGARSPRDRAADRRRPLVACSAIVALLRHAKAATAPRHRRSSAPSPCARSARGAERGRSAAETARVSTPTSAERLAAVAPGSSLDAGSTRTWHPLTARAPPSSADQGASVAVGTRR